MTRRRSGTSGSSSAAVESITRSCAVSRPGSGLGIEPVATTACLKRTFWGSSPSTRSPRESSKTPWPPPTTATSTSRTRSPITMTTSRPGARRSRSPLEEELLGALEPPHDGGGEAGAVGAVGDAVVERERERQQDSGHDAPLQHHRLLPRAGDAEDGDFGVIDDRDCARPAERSDVGEREGPAAQVLERGLALAHARGQGGELALELGQGLPVHVADHRDDQTA